MDIKNATTLDLLKSYHHILEELRRREIVRDSNPPTGGYGEYLAAKALGLKLEIGSNAGFDAIGKDNTRYEVKTRRISEKNKSRQLSAIRNIENQHFHYLIGIILAPDFTVIKGALVPYSVVLEKSKFQAHTNSSILILNDSIWNCEGVKDLTDVLIKTEALI